MKLHGTHVLQIIFAVSSEFVVEERRSKMRFPRRPYQNAISHTLYYLLQQRSKQELVGSTKQAKSIKIGPIRVQPFMYESVHTEAG